MCPTFSLDIYCAHYLSSVAQVHTMSGPTDFSFEPITFN